jgi:hypothetical protein
VVQQKIDKSLNAAECKQEASNASEWQKRLPQKAAQGLQAQFLNQLIQNPEKQDKKSSQMIPSKIFLED